MEQQVERFLQSLQAEKDFSINTISAYRNDLGQFVAQLRGGQGVAIVDGAYWRSRM